MNDDHHSSVIFCDYEMQLEEAVGVKFRGTKTEALVEVDVPHFDVSIIRDESGSWCVLQGKAAKPTRFFKDRAAAMAFGRALAFSVGVDLYVAGPNGERIRQPKESLTYPLALD